LHKKYGKLAKYIYEIRAIAVARSDPRADKPILSMAPWMLHLWYRVVHISRYAENPGFYTLPTRINEW